MLTRQATGPINGQYFVTYETPGCKVPTVECVCTTAGQAADEAARLNAVQLARELAIKAERDACGLQGFYPDLSDAERCRANEDGARA
jgi:hypothetical protein